ncbi:hypothetical protein CAC42_4244 [Sphaceloma murrayae]|uniref:Phosphotransferase n=1 Tax=Sphaceloma murrayae TaxID=2082308 RepID=A0A2K1QLF3_9PEZI|nr:hypothetical protein CAC42_4244 [Sphaceloma murrayae]
MEEYLSGVRQAFTSHLSPSALKALSSQLQQDFHTKLKSSDISFLPSFHHTLPTGSERGTFLALDVGGSNFRLALISLNTRSHPTEDAQTRVLHTLTFPITASVRTLRGHAFFTWMSQRIAEMLSSAPSITASFTASHPLQMGLAWSFPIHSTSQRSGYLLDMGKGFSATIGVQGQDLGDLIMRPCLEAGLPVHLATVVNDGSASLLSQAYRQPTTRMSLILGTGTNSSVYLPISALDKAKFGSRPEAWWRHAQRVCVNTELSMHGRNVWPMTRWDRELDRAHERPGFQPFEHFVGGRYLGEIVRLVLVDAVAEVGLFDGIVPEGLEKAYGLDSGVLAALEAETGFEDAKRDFGHVAGLQRGLTRREAELVREVAALVSGRAAAYEAAAVHALWEMRGRAEGTEKSRLANGASDGAQQEGRVSGATGDGICQLSRDELKVTIACNGSILDKYPGFRAKCQRYIDQLTSLSVEEMRKEGWDGEEGGRLVELSMARESSMFGAAVAAACCADEEG